MKNSMLSILCAATLMACTKNENTETMSTTDSTMTMPATDSGMMATDSTMMGDMTGSAALSDQDKMFADKAATGGMMEVMLGVLAETNSTHDKVKSLGKMMVDDHTKANDELKSWATAAGYNLPTALNADQQKKYNDMQAMKGADFDKAYADFMVTDHKEVIALFKKQAAEGSDSNLKSFASKTVPTLEQHLTASEEAKNAVK